MWIFYTLLLLTPLVIHSQIVFNWDHQQLINTIIPSYQTAIDLFDKNIIEELIDINIDSDEETLSTLADNLHCTAQSIHANIKQAAKTSTDLRRELNIHVGDLFVSIAKAENHVSDVEGNITELVDKIRSIQNQVNAAQNVVNEREEQFKAAESAYIDAKNALGNARECSRRRKRWLGGVNNWWRNNVERPAVRGWSHHVEHQFGRGWRHHVERPVVAGWQRNVIEPLCAIINRNGIRAAENRLSLARSSLDDARTLLDKYKGHLSDHLNDLNVNRDKLSSAQTNLQQLRNTLSEQQRAQSLAITLNEQLSKIERHLNNIFDSSIVLVKELEDLFDFEGIIGPLNAICRELNNANVFQPFNFNEISEETVSKIKNSLTKLADKVPNMQRASNRLNTQCVNTSSQLSVSDMSNDTESIDVQWSSSNNITALSLSRSRRNTYGDGSMGDVLSIDAQESVNPITEQPLIDEACLSNLIAAPRTVLLLGQLMVYASKKDFSLMDYTNRKTFTYIRNPESFRATLAQISHDGWDAFMGAHSSMNKIQLYMQQIPRHIKTARKLIIAKTSYGLINRLLPKTLSHMTRIGQECVTLARNTEDSFKNVKNLIAEVVEITLVSQKGHETELQAVQDELNVSRTIQAQNEAQKRQLDADVAEAKEIVRQARSQFSQALRDIPTGFKAILEELGHAVVGVIRGVGNRFGGRSGGSGGSSTGTSGSGGGGNGKGKQAPSRTVGHVLSLVGSYGKSIQMLKKIVNAANSTTGVDQLRAVQRGFQMWLRLIQGVSDNSIKQGGIELVQRGIGLIDELMSSLNDTGEISQENKGTIDDLLDDIKKYQVADAMTSSSGIESTSTTGNSGGGGGGIQHPSDSRGNARFAAQLAQSELRNAEGRFDKSYNDLRELMNEMRTLSARIATLHLNEIHFKEIIEVLRHAVRLLARIQAHWAQLILFFDQISSRIQIAVSETLTPYLEHAREASGTIATADDRKYLLQALDEQAVDVRHAAYVLFILSRTYVDISTKFLLGRLAGLSRLLTAQGADERSRLLNELSHDEAKVDKQVRELVAARQQAFEKHVSRRRTELETKIEDLGGENSEDKEAIDEGEQLLSDAS